MSNRIQITGPITEPETRYTPQNKQVLAFRVNATHAKYNEQSRQWEEVGEPFWVSVSLWERDAARFADHLARGTRITVEGVLTIRTFDRKDGTQGHGYDLVGARALGVVPAASQTGYQNAPGQAYTAGGYQTPAHDPWAAQNATQDQYGEAPF